VRNLVDNAFKYTAAGGVTVAADPDDTQGGASPCAIPERAIPVSESARASSKSFTRSAIPSADRSQGLGLVWRSCGGYAQLLELEVET